VFARQVPSVAVEPDLDGRIVATHGANRRASRRAGKEER
jgi:hypothetical protein